MVDNREIESGEVDVGALIDGAPWSSFQKFLIALIALAYLVDGVANQSLGLAIPALTKAWGLDRQAFASVAAIGLVGLTIGAAAGGMLGDRIGRKPMLVGSVMLFGVMTMAAGLATDIHTLFWLRFLDGLGMGAMIPNGAAMVSETTPLRKRATGIAVTMVFIAVGSMLSGLIAAVVLPAGGVSGHFYVLGASGVIAGVLLAVALPESPIFLARTSGRTPALEKVLGKFGLSLPDGAAAVVVTKGAAKAGLGVLFAADVRRSTLGLWFAFFFTLLASYSVFSWVPAMLADLGYPLSLASLGMTANGAGGIVGGVISGWLIERYGSRSAILASSVGCIATALALGGLIYSGNTSLSVIFGALAVLGFFISNVHNGMYTLSAYMYPPQARSTGVGSAAAIGRVGAIASSFVGVAALAMGGATSYFLVIALSIGLALVGTVMVTRQVPPTPR